MNEKITPAGLPNWFDRGVVVSLFPFLLVVAVVGVSGFFVLGPKVLQIKSNLVQVEDLKQKTRVVLAKRDYVASVDQEELIKDATYLEKAVLSQNDAYMLVNVFRKLADKHAFQVNSFAINPDKLAREDVLASQSAKTRVGSSLVPIKIVLVGKEENFINLLLTLEKSLPVLSLTSLKSKVTGDLIELEIDAGAYYVAGKKSSNLVGLPLESLKLNKDELAVVKKISGFTPIELQGQKSGERQLIKYQRNSLF